MEKSSVFAAAAAALQDDGIQLKTLEELDQVRAHTEHLVDFITVDMFAGGILRNKCWMTNWCFIARDCSLTFSMPKPIIFT